MPAPLRKTHVGIDLPLCQEQVRYALRRAFEHCGSQRAFVNALNARVNASATAKQISQQAVSWWLSEGTFVHPNYWDHIEAITDMAVTRRHLRPDIYGLGQP